ncbi:MAG: hypothetical protein Q8M08_16150 [Bacteroidales bacterium]|nr:hypothetical protein [Bacteroidales bacterium]
MKIYFTTLLLLLYGCASVNEKETTGFNEVLIKFNTQIPEKEHVYILIPPFSCHGCVQKMISKIDIYLSPQDKPYVTFISGIADIDLKIFSSRAVVYTDTHNYLEQLPFDIANVTVVETKKSMLSKVYSISLEDIENRINEKMFSFED